MIKKISSICILFFSLFLLVSCDDQKEKEEKVEIEGKEGQTMTYQIGLPEDSQGLQQFISNYISSDIGYYLFTKENTHIYSKKNLGSQQKTIEYYQYSEEQLKEYYQHLFDSSSVETAFTQLRNAKESLFLPVEDKVDFHLPSVEWKEGNILTIDTGKSKKEFDLPDLIKEYQLNSTDKITFNLVALSEHHFQIDIHNQTIDDPLKKDVTIYFSQDLEHVFVTQTYTETFLHDLVDGSLEVFDDLLVHLDSNNRFIKAANSHVIVDSVEKGIIDVHEADYVSEDNQYVYINGNLDPIIEGSQHIQLMEEYLTSAQTYDSKFQINYEKIAEKLELTSTGNVSTGKVVYFQEDFIILFLNFTAPVAGTAGSTNVIIDLQENKENPTFYLIDLGLQ